MITLQVTGLTNGESVVVQKFLDANTNGVIDAGDLLVQQFNLTDGANSVIGGVTNINVPGDSNSTTGAITSLITVKNGDFVQSTIGQYSFKVSSPVGRFAPLTNLFRITNFPFAQTITGTVVSSGTNVPNAVVLLLPAPRPGHGPGNPQAATVANNSGSFTLQTPPGTYVPLAFKSNFIANFTTAPVLSLASGQAINTNLVLTTATASISGRLVDAANTSIGLPGIFGPASANGLISVGFTDSNGNFNLRVSSGQWNVGSSDSGLIVHGYVGYQDSTNIDTTGGNVTNLTFHVNKATAMFYGSVKDSLGNPLAGIDVFSQDNYGVFATDGYTDAKGNYVIGVVGDFFGDFWNVQLDTGGGSGNPTIYIFSQSASQQDGGTELAAGQALLQNFTAILATNHITGHVQSGGTNLVGVQVSAYANLGGLDYQAQLETDVGGNYSLNVADGGWNVSVNCYGGDSSLDGLLGSGNYQCPDNQNVNIANGNGTANFSVPLCNDLQITTSSLVDGEVGVGYAAFLNASSCYNPFMWSLVSGSLPPGLQLNSDGEIHGTPSGGGTFSFTIQVMDGVNATTDRVLSLTISQPPHIGLVTQLTGHQLQFQINGRASHLYNIQSSTNLVDWLTVKTYAPTASVFSVVLNIASNEPHRFYRAVLGPGFTDSITQLIGASEGGSISLPGGATVTIPPDFLTNDMTVTIYKLSTFPGEVPDAAISSVGPVLFFSFQAAPDSLSSFHSSGRKKPEPRHRPSMFCSASPLRRLPGLTVLLPRLLLPRRARLPARPAIVSGSPLY